MLHLARNITLAPHPTTNLTLKNKLKCIHYDYDIQSTDFLLNQQSSQDIGVLQFENLANIR